MVATFGIAYTDLPALLVYQFIIIGVSAIFSWNKDINWARFWGYIALAQFIGIIFFATEWYQLWIFRHLPLPAIAAIVGTGACHIPPIIMAIIKRIGG